MVGFDVKVKMWGLEPTSCDHYTPQTAKLTITTSVTLTVGVEVKLVV